MDDGRLPPLSQAGPCRKGCGRVLGAAAGPRGKHEKGCDGKPKAVKTEAKPKANPGHRGIRPFISIPKPVAVPPAGPATADNWVAMTRERARLMRAAGERQIAQAARLEEVAAEFEGSF